MSQPTAVRPDPDLDADVQDLAAAVEGMRDASLRAGMALVRIEQRGLHVAYGASSIAHFGELVAGLTAQETRRLVDLAKGVRASRVLASEFAAGRLSVGAASALGEVARKALPLPRSEGASSSGDPETEMTRWVQAARQRSFVELRHLVDRAKEQVRVGPPPVAPFVLHKTAKARAAFDRAWMIASRKSRRVVTPSEADEMFVDHYLASFDPDRVRPGTRRVGDTRRLQGSRYVPAQVLRDLRRRTGGKCVLPLCDNRIWIQAAHIVPHRRGGSREADNLFGPCSRHHVMHDRGHLRRRGPPQRPVFYDRCGRRIRRRRILRRGSRSPPP